MATYSEPLREVPASECPTLCLRCSDENTKVPATHFLRMVVDGWANTGASFACTECVNSHPKLGTYPGGNKYVCYVARLPEKWLTV